MYHAGTLVWAAAVAAAAAVRSKLAAGGAAPCGVHRHPAAGRYPCAWQLSRPRRLHLPRLMPRHARYCCDSDFACRCCQCTGQTLPAERLNVKRVAEEQAQRSAVSCVLDSGDVGSSFTIFL